SPSRAVLIPVPAILVPRLTPKIEKKTVKPSFAKIDFVKSEEQVKSSRKTTVKQVEKPKQNTHRLRGKPRNWNNMMSQKLRSNFEMFNKAGYARPVNNARPRPVNTARPNSTIVNAVRVNQVNDVKASACWV
nr:hypothetical protein [Tanacetum cinerariifolium]